MIVNHGDKRCSPTLSLRKSALSTGLLLLCCLLSGSQVFSQDTENPLVNGDFESFSANNKFAGWIFASPGGGKLIVDSETKNSGQHSAQVHSESSSTIDRLFSNVMQNVSAKALRGKKVRYRASVKTADLSEGGSAQLWFRVDRKSEGGRPRPGAFDNMDSRPIRGSSEWQPYEIVLKVDDDAESIALGMFLKGNGKAWIDDATLEVIADDTPTTERKGGSSANNAARGNNAAPSRQFSQLPPRVAEAISVASEAPTQPFFTRWLWLPLIAILLMLIAGWPTATNSSEANDTEKRSFTLRFIKRFSIRFTLVYWLLYGLQTSAIYSVPYIGSWIAAHFRSLLDVVTARMATNWFQIEHELVPPNGSGDTTFNYLTILFVFLAALTVAIVWSLVDFRKTDYRVPQDLLRSYLRYMIALLMLGYGLAKVAWTMNQFPSPSDFQLNKAWGDSSPMNVLWTFLGSSRAYTVFGGLGEIASCVFLLFRRTTVLGAAIAFGVMINVMMMNYCYDVPVKILSTHLVVMALYLLLPDVKRLVDFLLLNRATEPAEIRPPYVGPKTIWVQRAIKAVILIGLFAIPISFHARREIGFLMNGDSESASNNSRPAASGDHLLTRRGFRWINEVPFNR